MYRVTGIPLKQIFFTKRMQYNQSGTRIVSQGPRAGIYPFPLTGLGAGNRTSGVSPAARTRAEVLTWTTAKPARQKALTPPAERGLLSHYPRFRATDGCALSLPLRGAPPATIRYNKRLSKSECWPLQRWISIFTASIDFPTERP